MLSRTLINSCAKQRPDGWYFSVPVTPWSRRRMQICGCGQLARGISTSIIHAASISSAVCGLSGLQNYRFGKSCSIPFPQKNWFPTTSIDVIALNLSLRLHTLAFLDIQDERYMTVHEAIALLEPMAAEKGYLSPCMSVLRVPDRIIP